VPVAVAIVEEPYQKARTFGVIAEEPFQKVQTLGVQQAEVVAERICQKT